MEIKQSDQQQIMNAFSSWRILIPLGIGLAVVVLMFVNQFEYEEFKRIDWTSVRLVQFLLIAVLIYVLRHLMYAYRLRLLSDQAFSFRKSIQLVFLWEFASAISPTSVGGSAVAILFLAQEKISTARATGIVMYTVIIDTLFFLVTGIFLLLIYGPSVIRPGLDSLTSGYGLTFVIVWLFMLFYGSILFIGSYKPQFIGSILKRIGRLKFMHRFQDSLDNTSDELVITSEEYKNKPFLYHFKVILLTIGAWVTRFLTINFIILALVEIPSVDHLLLYARSQIMYMITQFSPTPGGSGVMGISVLRILQ